MDRRKQIEQTKAGIEKLKSWGFDAELVGLWIDKNWKVYEIVEHLRSIFEKTYWRFAACAVRGFD